MLRVNWEHLPKWIIYHISYILYYSFTWYIFWLFFILWMIAYEAVDKMTDYQLFVLPIFFAIPLWIFTSVIVTPIEKKIIKRNIFIAWLIQVLKKHKSISFNEIIENYSYFIFQSRKVTSRDYEWSTYIEALIALWIIDLNNHKKLKEKNKDFDYKIFNKKLFEAELILKDKNVNIDELIKKLDNFVL